MQRKNKIVKATLCTFLAGVLAFSDPMPAFHAEESILDLQAQYDKLEAEIQKNQKKLEQSEQNRSDQKEVVTEIESELNGLSSQITILDKKIELLNGEIDTLSASIRSLNRDMDQLNGQISQARTYITESKKQINETHQKVLERCAISYMAGSGSALELLLGAKSLADVLSWQQYIKNASDYDRNMIRDLENNIDALTQMEAQLDAAVAEMNEKKEQAEQQKAELEVKQADVATSAGTLAVKQNAANTKRIEAYSLLRELDTESEAYKQLDEQMREEEERLYAEINLKLAKKASVMEEPVPAATTAAPITTTTTTTTTTTATTTTTSTTARDKKSADEEAFEDTTESTTATTTATTTTTTTQPQTQPASTGSESISPKERGLICPIQDPHAVVSGTFPAYKSGGVHHGIDIVVTDQGKTYGHDIVAAQSGKVISCIKNYYSYGNYLEIDHGNGLVTRYAHCKDFVVSEGQTVSKGQVIAHVGDTGNVTGPHLHFEVHINTKNGLILQNPLDYITVP